MLKTVKNSSGNLIDSGSSASGGAACGSKASSVWWRVGACCLAVALALTSFSHEAEARRRHRKAKKGKKAPVINEKVLYERLGGQKTMNDIVDEWLRLDLADSRISAQLGDYTAKPEKLQRLRRDLGDQLCELADGPCQYKGADMKKGYAGLKLGEDDFVAFSENLFKSMQKFGVQEREKNELLGRIGAVRIEGTAENIELGSMDGTSSKAAKASKAEKASAKSEKAEKSDSSEKSDGAGKSEDAGKGE